VRDHPPPRLDPAPLASLVNEPGMTGSLWAQALQHAELPKGPPCGVTTLIADLATTHPDLAAEFAASINGSEMIVKIQRGTVWLVQQGIVAKALSANQITRHRRHLCQCR